MKKICTFAAMLLAIMSLMCSCQGDDPEFSVDGQDADNLVYTYEHQTVKLSVSTNRSWKASCSEDWLELGESGGKAGEGQQLTFSLTENKDYTYRKADITVKAGGSDFVLSVTQAPQIHYYVNEKFDVSGMIAEAELPDGWYSLDNDGDGWGWRCVKDEEGGTYAYSASYYDNTGKTLEPDEYLVSPAFTLPSTHFSLRWTSKTYDTEYPGDKYEVWSSRFVDGRLELLLKLYEGATGASAEPQEHLVSLKDYDDLHNLRIAFRHFDSKGLGRVLITNVEVSNR